MILLIDNYDSFVYNLAQFLGELGAEIRVRRNDKISIEEIEHLAPTTIMISPGPGTPKDSGISPEVLLHFKGRIPMMGVCLGHQTIGEVFGGKVIRADKILHGKTSKIYHDGKTIFENIENPFTATRYHSLIVERKTLPDCFTLSAWTEDETVMAIRHKEYNIEGVQFHPESVLTNVGMEILKNFIKGREID
ncbi:aminodeoxychorismate/anthranilate synthase component II [candidate division WOR-3 bacterium]|nr:aminodeoxychorismate/anthranilate synthase component II [candidate division WOR-3 bacterium]